MAETTGIAWARSTMNPWIGCTEVSPGCDACYARVLDARHRWGGATHWGAGVPRYRTGLSSWQHPHQWNSAAAHELATGKVLTQSKWKGKPGFWPVFPSLCDPFDNEVPEEWRRDFWKIINVTPNLTWLLLTKRIGNAVKMLPGTGRSYFPNVWLGASIVNQEEADRDIPKLLRIHAAKRFVSYEPGLGPVDFSMHLGLAPNHEDLRGLLHQIIVGGESTQGGAKARPFNIEWARSTVRQCKQAGVACFVKQLGSTPFETFAPGCDHFLTNLRDRAGADPAEWPEDLRAQEFPA
jgi:protein gp37